MVMDKYTLMRLSEKTDCEAIDLGDFELSELLELYEQQQGESIEKFKEKYKTFYTDIKISHREDW